MCDTSNIRNVVTDVDGVLTDGKFLYNTDGKVLKTFGPHDSDGFKIIKGLGIQIHAISADYRGFSITQKRLEDMGVHVSLVNETDRINWIKSRFNLYETMFVGDGYYDIVPLKECAIGVSPYNAPDIVKLSADIITKSMGSEGVFLELALTFLADREKQRSLSSQ
jgi:YrbI family 3-deoxy-D-manno-octulosonate 8-phosphate phosphatase